MSGDDGEIGHIASQRVPLYKEISLPAHSRLLLSRARDNRPVFVGLKHYEIGAACRCALFVKDSRTAAWYSARPAAAATRTLNGFGEGIFHRKQCDHQADDRC